MTHGRRIAASACIVLLACLAIVSGLDRISGIHPQTARLLPAAVKAETWRVEAAAALAASDASLASGLAAEAVAADPFDPRGASILATALLAQGRQEEAREAFEAADRLGLRTPLVQAYFFEDSLAKGDAQEAARRLDILLRAHPSMAGIDYFFGALEGSKAGRSELAQRIFNDPLWSDAYLTGAGSADEVLVARARFLAGEGSEIRLGCDRIDAMMRELARRNFRAEAQKLAREQCPDRAAAQAVTDPGFMDIGEEDALGWNRHSSGDVRIASIAGRASGVEVENRSATTRLVLSQAVVLEQGEYRIFASVAAERSDTLVVSLDCGEPRRPTRGSGSLERGQLVAVTGCSEQVLGLWLRPRSGPVRIDDLRLTPVGLYSGEAVSSKAE